MKVTKIVTVTSLFLLIGTGCAPADNYFEKPTVSEPAAFQERQGLAAPAPERPIPMAPEEAQQKGFNFAPTLVSKGQTDFACTSVASAYITKPIGENRVIGEFSAGTDVVSISFNYEDGIMKMITAAAVKAGETEAETFTLVEDTSVNAVAIAKHGALGPNYSVFVFDKETQQAVWTKA